MERVFRDHLNMRFDEWLPITGPVSRNVISQYLTARAAQGAKRTAIQHELRLWNKAVLDMANYPLKSDWVMLQFNSMFPQRMTKPNPSPFR